MHDYSLHEAMEKTRKAGIKLNFAKCIVKAKSCSFFGEIYTPQGVRCDPKKVEAITKMQVPSTKQELHSFLGMINYLIQFIPSMSDLTSNLRKLLKKDVLFQWKDSHEKEFQELKSKVSSDACLQYFDTAKPVTLQVDVSRVGLGAVLIQKDNQGRSRPVVSKSLPQLKPGMLI